MWNNHIGVKTSSDVRHRHAKRGSSRYTAQTSRDYVIARLGQSCRRLWYLSVEDSRPFGAQTMIGTVIGQGMIALVRKPPKQEMYPQQKEFNTAVNSIRYKIERTIANLKTWRTLHTDYRRPLHTFPETISAIIALEFYRMSL